MLSLRALIIAALAAAIGVSSVYIFKMKPNNIIETEAESVIKDETGLDVNLSPL